MQIKSTQETKLETASFWATNEKRHNETCVKENPSIETFALCEGKSIHHLLSLPHSLHLLVLRNMFK
jgi:hypothetical protein